MADAYGALVFSKSVDCSIEIEKMVRSLNRFEWSGSDGEWECNDGGGIYYSDPEVEYPRVSVERKRFIMENEDGVEFKKYMDEMSSDDWDNILEVERIDCDYEDVAKELSQCIEDGWIEIACCSNEALRYIRMEILRLNADGSGWIHYVTSGPRVESQIKKRVIPKRQM